MIATKHSKLLWILTFCAVGMFGFTFVLIPIYSVFCKVTGLNGKIDFGANIGTYGRQRIAVNSDSNTDTNSNNSSNEIINRFVIIEFDSNRNQEVPCEFKPEHPILQVKPGELAITSYYIRNLTNRKMILQAIPSISPGLAAKHLKKLECFCFNQQELLPYESLQMPLRFWLEPEIPDTVFRLTLSYTLFDVTKLKEKDRKKGEAS